MEIILFVIYHKEVLSHARYSYEHHLISVTTSQVGVRNPIPEVRNLMPREVNALPRVTQQAFNRGSSGFKSHALSNSVIPFQHRAYIDPQTGARKVP